MSSQNCEIEISRKGGDFVNCYFRKDTKLINFDPSPRFLAKTELSSIAKIVYTALLGRTLLSRENGMMDQEGKIYVIFTLKELAKFIGRTVPIASGTLKELEAADLIERKKIKTGLPNHIYVKLPEDKECFRRDLNSFNEGTKENDSQVVKNSIGNPLNKLNTNKKDNKNINKSYEKGYRV